MRLSRRLALVVSAALLSTAACVESSEPTATPANTPADAANLEMVRVPVWANGLRWDAPRVDSAEASAVIGPEGGELVLRRTGLVLHVPAGAVAAPTRFAARALPGSIVAYEFEPHGTTFAKPVSLEQSLRGTRAPDGAAFEGAYFASRSQLDQAVGVLQVDEFRPARAERGVVRFDVRHFSGYALATSRR